MAFFSLLQLDNEIFYNSHLKRSFFIGLLLFLFITEKPLEIWISLWSLMIFHCRNIVWRDHSPEFDFHSWWVSFLIFVLFQHYFVLFWLALSHSVTLCLHLDILLLKGSHSSDIKLWHDYLHKFSEYATKF